MLLLGACLDSVPGKYWPWFAALVPFAMAPLIIGPRWYRLAGGVGLVLSGILISGDIAAGKLRSARARRYFTITDVTKAETFDLTPTTDMLEISHIQFHFQGNIGGQAYMLTHSYATQALSGPIDFRFGEDVSATNYVLRYFPLSVTNGNLKVTYKFD